MEIVGVACSPTADYIIVRIECHLGDSTNANLNIRFSLNNYVCDIQIAQLFILPQTLFSRLLSGGTILVNQDKFQGFNTKLTLNRHSFPETPCKNSRYSTVRKNERPVAIFPTITKIGFSQVPCWRRTLLARLYIERAFVWPRNVITKPCKPRTAWATGLCRYEKRRVKFCLLDLEEVNVQSCQLLYTKGVCVYLRNSNLGLSVLGNLIVGEMRTSTDLMNNKLALYADYRAIAVCFGNIL